MAAKSRPNGIQSTMPYIQHTHRPCHADGWIPTAQTSLLLSSVNPSTSIYEVPDPHCDSDDVPNHPYTATTSHQLNCSSQHNQTTHHSKQTSPRERDVSQSLDRQPGRTTAGARRRRQGSGPSGITRDTTATASAAAGATSLPSINGRAPCDARGATAR